MKAVTLAALVAASSLPACSFAIKHPAVTAGIVGGVVAITTCELGTDFDGEHATCGVITAGTALALGGIVWLATVLGGDGHTVFYEDKAAPEVPQDPTLDAPPPAVPQDPTLDAPPPPAPMEPAPAEQAPSPSTP